MLTYAAVAALSYVAAFIALTTLYEVGYALRQNIGVRTHLIRQHNHRMYTLSQHLPFDLPQMDARTKTQRAEDDAFLAIGATYHREQ